MGICNSEEDKPKNELTVTQVEERQEKQADAARLKMPEERTGEETAALAASPQVAQAPKPQLPPLYAVSWANQVKTTPDANCLTFDGPYTAEHNAGVPATFTFAEIDARANRLARALAARHGVTKGHRLVTVCDNRPEMFTLAIACLKTGVTLVPLATDLMTEHEQGLVSAYEPSLVISSFPGRNFPKPASAGDTGLRASLGEEVDARACWPTLELAPYYQHEGGVFDRMETEGDGSPVEITAAYDDISFIFSTSGSTGVPKGVMYTGMTLAFVGATVAIAKMKNTPLLPDGEVNSTQLLWVPMRGVVGTSLSLSLMAAGVRSIMCDTATAGPSVWADLVQRHSVTFFCLFGAAMQRMIKELPADATLPTVSVVSYGGSCFPPTLIQQSMEQFPNGRFSQGYSMTECMGISSLPAMFHKKRGEPCSAVDMKRMSSAGVLIPGFTECFLEPIDAPLSGEKVGDIPDDEEGNERFKRMGRQRGEGQICVKNAFIMKGYYGNPTKTAEAIGADQFMRTGDIGKFDEHGFLYVIGRLKEVIPTHAGYNIAPRDVEEVLFKHPGVGEAAVIGIPHESGAGEMVVAWVSLKPGAEGITPQVMRDHCKEQGLPPFQTPAAFEITTEPLPEHGGKVSKKLLRNPSFTRQGLADKLEDALSKAVAADPETPKEVVEAQMFFERIDADASSRIEEGELAAVVGEEKAKRIMELADTNNDGELDAEEWAAVLRKIPDSERAQLLATMGSVLASWEKDKFGSVQKPFTGK